MQVCGYACIREDKPWVGVIRSEINRDTNASLQIEFEVVLFFVVEMSCSRGPGRSFD